MVWAHFDGGYFGRVWYPSAIGAVLLLAGIAFGTGRLLPGSRPARVALLLLVGLVAWSFLSMAWADSPGSALEAASKLLLVVTLAWALSLLAWTPRAGLALLLTWSLGVAAVCAISLVGAVNATELGDLFFKGRYMDPLGYANAAAALPMMAFLPALLLACEKRTPAALRVLLLAVAAFLLQFALLPQSRGGLIAMAAVSLLLLAVAPDRLRLIVGVGVVAAVTVPSIAPIFHVYDVAIPLSNAGLAPSEEVVGKALGDAARSIAVGTGIAGVVGVLLVALDGRLSPGERTVRGVRVGAKAVLIGAVVVGGAAAVINAGSIYDTASDRWETFKSDKRTPNVTGPRISANSSEQRYDYWRVALESFRDEPLLGLGAGNYGRHYDAERRYAKPSRYTHDIWLSNLAQGGVVGILLLLAFLAIALGRLLSVRRRGAPDAALLAAATGLVTAYFCLHASFDWLEEFPALAVPAFAFPLVALVATTTGSSGARKREMHRGRRLGIAAGLGLASVAVAVLSVQFLALRYYERGGRLGASSPQAALEDLDRAASLNPLWVKPYTRAGAIAVETGDRARARAAFRDALDVEESWYAHLELALLDAQIGRFRPARRELELATRLNANDEFLAKARESLGRRERIDPAAFNNAMSERLRALLGSPRAGSGAHR